MGHMLQDINSNTRFLLADKDIPAMILSEAITHCRQMVKKFDYPNYVCSTFLPTSVQPFKWALGALNIETARIKSSTDQIGLGQIKMQFWSDLIQSFLNGDDSKLKDSPILLILKHFSTYSTTMNPRLRRFISARAEDQGRSAYFSIAEIERYSEDTYSNLMYLLLEVMRHSNLELDHAASHFGKAQGLIAFTRGTLPLSSCGLDPGLPADLLAKYNYSQQMLIRAEPDIWKEQGMKNLVHEMAAVAHSHLSLARKHLLSQSQNQAILKRIFLPVIPAINYLKILEKVDFDLSDSRLYQTSIDRWLPLQAAWAITFRGTPLHL